MSYAFLIFSVFTLSVQQILQKYYDTKATARNAFFFAGISSLFALVFFCIIAGFKFSFTPEFIPYSIGFATAYALCTVCINTALSKGTLSITNLIYSYSLLIPTFYGIIFLKEKISYLAYIGIALLAISLLLINFKKEQTKFSFAWIVFLAVSFVGNGMCAVIQKMQQTAFNGNYKSEFMIVALAICTVVLIISGMFMRGNKKQMLKDCGIAAPAVGIANGITNLATMVLFGLIPNAIIFPTISGGSMVVTLIVSIIMFKEKLSKLQILGYSIGIISVVLLNI